MKKYGFKLTNPARFVEMFKDFVPINFTFNKTMDFDKLYEQPEIDLGIRLAYSYRSNYIFL